MRRRIGRRGVSISSCGYVVVAHRWFVCVLIGKRLRDGGRRSVDLGSQLPFFSRRFHRQMSTGEGGRRIGQGHAKILDCERRQEERSYVEQALGQPEPERR